MCRQGSSLGGGTAIVILNVLLLLFLAGAPSAAAPTRVPRYHAIYLGTFGHSGSAYGINSAGDVVGESVPPAGTSRAFLYSGSGPLQNLGTLGGSDSDAYAINDAGQITGYSRVSPSTALHPFIYSGGVMTDLGSFGGTSCVGRSINSSGWIAGYDTLAGDSTTCSFIYRGSLPWQEIGTLGGTRTYAFGLNDLGHVVGYSTLVGYSQRRAFVYDGSEMHNLGTLEGGDSSEAYAINNSGQIVGTSTVSGGDSHAFLYAGSGPLIDLGSLGGTVCNACAINGSGVIVGDSRLTGSSTRHAWIYIGDTLYDLNSLLATADGFTSLTYANGINDEGVICGSGQRGTYGQPYKLVPNALPVAHPDTYGTGVNTPLDVPAVAGVLANDTDADAVTFGQTLQAVGVSDPAHGTVTLHGDGSFRYEPAPDYVGYDSFTYRANDGAESGEEVATVTLRVENHAPGVPTTLTISPGSPRCTSTLAATAGGSTDSDPGDSVSYKYEWSLSTDGGSSWDSWGRASTDGGLAAVALHRGEVWRVRACAFDGLADSAWCEPVQVTIGNSAPTAPPTLTLAPATPLCTSTVTATAEGATDADTADLVSYKYEWSMSGDQGNHWDEWGRACADGRLAGVSLHKTELWRVRACSTDGTADSGWSDPAQVAIGNTPPAPATSLEITPTAPRSNEDLTAAASGATDADDDPLAYSYEWASSSDGGQTWSAWGHSGASLSGSDIARGEQWKARVHANDGSADSAYLESAAVTVGNALPTAPDELLVSPADPGTMRDLAASAAGATDPDDDVLGYEYEWAKSTDNGSSWGDWGAPGAVLSADLTTRGEQWRARARARDGSEYGPWLVSASVTVVNTAPVVARTLLITPSHPTTVSDLRAKASGATDADGDALVQRYQWSCSTDGGTTWSGWSWSGLLLPHARTTRDELWRVRCRASDGFAWSKWRTSSPVTIANSAPSAPAAVEITPGAPGFSVDLKASADGSTDADSDTLTYSFQWARSKDAGTSWSGWNWSGPKLSASLTVKGDLWKARGRAGDGTARGPWCESSPVTIGAHPAPQLAALTVRAVPAPTAAGPIAVTVSLSAPACVRGTVFTVAGRPVAQLGPRDLPAGLNVLALPCRGVSGLLLPAGPYLLRLTAAVAGPGAAQAQAVVPLTLGR